MPWSLSIWVKEGTYLSRGGSILNQRYILTAAHCLTSSGIPFSPNLVRVHVGFNNKCVSNGLWENCLKVEKTILHKVSDIGLVKLMENIKFSLKSCLLVFQ